MRRSLAILIVAGCLALPATAAAHVEVADTSASSAGVSVTFTGPLRSGTLKVKAIGGGKASRGSGGRDPRNVARVRTELRSGAGAGRYRAKWKIVSADGHEQAGSFTFTL